MASDEQCYSSCAKQSQKVHCSECFLYWNQGIVYCLIVIDRPCAISPVCCWPTTPRSAPPHSKTTSVICGGFVTKTRWYTRLTLWLGSQHRSPLQNPSPSVLRGRLMSSSRSLPSKPCPHVLSYHSSTGPPVVPLQVLSHRFQLCRRKCLDTSCAAVRQQGCEAFHLTVTSCFCIRSSGFLPIDLAGEWHAADQYPNTRCSWQAKCAFRMCSKTTGQDEQHRWIQRNCVSGSRLDQVCVSVPHKHHSCAWRLPGWICVCLHRDVTLVPACDLMEAPCFHGSSTSASVFAMNRTRTVLFHLRGLLEYIHHIGCAINLHSITNSWLIPGGQNLSKRQTVFFTSVDLMNEEHKDLETVDLKAPRLARYLEETSEHGKLGRHQSCSEERIGVLSNAIKRHHPLKYTPNLLSLKLFRMETGEKS